MTYLTEAVKILKQGGIVIYPTDTAFGIGCRIDNKKSIQKLFRLRKRPQSRATPVLVDSIRMAEKYFISPLPDNVRHIMRDYWPGALTVVYRSKQDLIPPLVRGGGDTIGLRIPNHDIPMALINAVGVPILGPSANFHGQNTPYKFSQLDSQLVELADYVIDGKCLVGNVSTVIDCVSNPFKILRLGGLKVDDKYLK